MEEAKLDRALEKEEKVRQVVELQKATWPMIRRRRELASCEEVWTVEKAK